MSSTTVGTFNRQHINRLLGVLEQGSIMSEYTDQLERKFCIKIPVLGLGKASIMMTYVKSSVCGV